MILSSKFTIIYHEAMGLALVWVLKLPFQLLPVALMLEFTEVQEIRS